MVRHLSGFSAAFATVTTLFFAWGFIASNNDPLIASLKASFHLSYTEALMVQLVSFAAYGWMSFPAAALLERVGTFRAILAALGLLIASRSEAGRVGNGCVITSNLRWPQ